MVSFALCEGVKRNSWSNSMVSIPRNTPDNTMARAASFEAPEDFMSLEAVAS
jgi:hypothetical protein